MRFKLLVGAALIIPLVLALFSLVETRPMVGQPFAGYLSYENGVVGPFYVPGWWGPENGVIFNSLPTPSFEPTQIFDKLDFILVVLFPLASGLIFVLLGILVSFFIPDQRSKEVFVLFHLLAGVYQILSVDFQTTHHYSFELMMAWIFMPAAMIHFAWLFPQKRWVKSWPTKIPYILAGAMLIAYDYYFKRDPAFWIHLQSVWAFVVVAAYLYWIFSLWRQKNHQGDSFKGILAAYVLWGQIIAFSLPLLAFVFLFILKIPFPLNLAVPLTFLFPASCFAGVMLARVKQSQRELFVAEKRALTGQLFAGLAHELKNPLNFVYANIEPLHEMIDQLPQNKIVDEMKAAVKDIELGAMRAVNLLNDFRTLAIGKVGPATLVNVSEVIDKAIHLLQHEFPASLVVKKVGIATTPISAHENELLRLFINLLSNASQAMPEGGEIQIITEESQNELSVKVQDQGSGIAPSEMEKIFDPFYTTKEQGMGLGLTLVNDLVHKNGAVLKVDSVVGRGTSFEIIWKL